MKSEYGSNLTRNWIHDVHLSFSPDDACESFVSDLSIALAKVGFCVYRHDEMLKRDMIESLNSIHESRICIIVFSKMYAQSIWCLEELKQIMECHRTLEKIVLPVFYEVDPSEIRRQRGIFGKAFEDFTCNLSDENDRVMSWRVSLKEAASLAGFVVLNSRNGYEQIKRIVQHITSLFGREELFIAEHPVGVKSRVKEVIKLLATELSEDVIFVGMFGIAGIGKTTIAKAVFNEIGHNFEGRSFLKNVRETWEEDPIYLQRSVIYDILKTKPMKIGSIESGKYILKERLALRKVLLVLDDVNELDQLNALCGSRNWFGPGSRIIITTREMHLLKTHGVYNVYNMKELNQNESLELFSWHAFLQPMPEEEFVELSRIAVAYSEGLPLALLVLGSYLFGRSILEWKGMLNKFQIIPNAEIQASLQVSFDYLLDNEKEIFLDIACFFVGMDKNDVIHILNGCGLSADFGIRSLVERSLVTIDKVNKVGMLHLLRDMGREIIRQESPQEPGKRSRLWFYDDAFDVLSNYEGTPSIRGLALKLRREDTICLNTKAFKGMRRLRLLQLAGVQLEGNYKYLPQSLKYLCWHGFPLTYVPAELHLKSLVVIEFKYSNLKNLWKKNQMLENLKVLNLSHSKYLISTPDFSYMPNLEKLVLEDCSSLCKISNSIGHLNKLLLLNLRDCTELCNLPRSIYTLKCLKELILSGCSLIDKLEEDLEQMESLTTLIANNTAISKVPFSIVRLKYLKYISINGYEGYSHDVIPSIDWSRMSPTNNLSSQFPNDVFLSFRGEDTRESFTSHLYDYLQNAKINVFMDDCSLQMGDQISASLLRAIENSRISIIIFSRNYADSGWCVRELEKVMECHRTIGQIVLPVFYDVEPSDVRHQTGSFGKAFEKLLNRILENEETVLNWRMALREAGGISGTVIQNFRNQNKVIKNIVERVSRLLNKTELFVPDHLVGIESRLQTTIELLNSQSSKDVLYLGIWGMGGIGKTTIAKAIYNQIGANFEDKSFLSNIREVWEQYTNRVSLQQWVLDDVCKTPTKEIHNIESGKKILKETLAQKKVLLVLDDVNELDQLNALCGSGKWFGSGSRIIITTRNHHLLKVSNVDLEYRIGEMDERESLEHFCWHAFKQNTPKEGFATHSRSIVDYSKGLPLALEVLGSHLFGRPITEWDSLLKRLETIPDDQVHKKLKISFDGLNHEEKEIFLDISCFFIGMDRNYVIKILNGCGFSAEIGISALVERSLVTIDGKNKLQMHDLLRDMGREIIREKSPEPEERSRLWLTEEVFNVLSQKKGSKAIKGLALKLKNTTFNLENTICFETKTFKKMYNLRLLQLVGVRLDGDYRYLSRDLKWLCWLGFPSTYIPAEFYQESLIAMELKYSNLEEIWMQGQKLENLKVLNLSHSHNLNKTADFSCLPNLEKLLLKDCRSLCTVSNTIGCLNKLLLINLKNCTSLQNLPTSIYKLKALEIMILSGCIMIDKLEDLKEMESLTKLIADNTAIEEVPPSIVNLKSIAYISLCGFEGLSCDVFPSLIRYWRSNNVTSWDPTSALSFPVSLDVPHSNSSSHAIPSTFKVLPNLQNVKSGSQFQVTHDVEMFLDILKSTNHNKEGEASATASQVSDMNTFSSSDRNKQVQIWKEKTFYKSLLIQMGTKCQAPNISSDINFLTTDGLGDSDWSTFSCNGSSVRFELSQMDGCRLKSMILMINYSSSGNITSEGCQNVLFMNCTKRTIVVYKRDKLSSFEDDEWNSITSNLEPGDKMEIIVIFEHGFVVQKTTVYLKYDEPIHEEMENCHAIDKDVTFSGENGDKDVTFSHDDDVSEDKNFAVSGGDENVEATSTASNEFSSQKLTEDPKPGSILVHQNPWDEDHEDEQPPIPLRIRKESNNQKFQFSSEQVESQEMNQGINQNVEVDDSTNLATPFLPNPEQMQVEGNAHIFERKSEDFHGKGNAFSFENQPVDESRPTNPPCSSSMQADSYDGAKEQSVEILEEVSKSITLPFDIESMNQLINDDPLSAIENMLSGEIQQYTTQIDMPKVESSLVNQLLESLKMFLFNKQDMKDALLHEVDTKMVKFIFEELSKVYDQLPAAIKAFIIQSHKFFDEALTHTKKYAHAISKLSSYEQTKKEFIEKARKIKDNDSRLATLTTSSKEKLQVFNTQIVELEKQLEELKKQRDNLQQDMIKCEEQRQNKKIENENFAHQILAILIKMKKNEEDVKTANAGVQASKAIFQELKSNLPF